MSSQPTVLVIGATGQTGRLIVADLKRDPGNVRLRLAAHKEADVERLKSGDYEAVISIWTTSRRSAPPWPGLTGCIS